MYKILIVDDREIFRRQFKRFRALQDQDRFQVAFEAQNGVEALEILRSSTVDVVVTDIRMPMMDGIELLQQIKSEELCGCVVLLSEYADFSYAKEGLVLGAFDYIVKPMDEEKLASLLQRAAEFLDQQVKQNNGLMAEARLLAPLILKQDEYALTISRQIARKSITEKRDDLFEVYKGLESVLSTIRKQVLNERPFLVKYGFTDRMFKIIGESDIDQVEECFVRKIAMIMKETGIFQVQTRNKMIQAICHTLVTHVEDNFSLQDVADRFNMNKCYLSHVFKQETGMSFVDYTVWIKLERSRFLLVETEDKVYEISSLLGYEDAEYFGKLFKQTYGVTPTLYRKREAAHAG